MAPYTGLISDIFVSIGQKVQKGEVLASVTNRETLQNYSIKSPISGVVTEQYLKRGELASTRLRLAPVLHSNLAALVPPQIPATKILPVEK